MFGLNYLMAQTPKFKSPSCTSSQYLVKKKKKCKTVFRKLLGVTLFSLLRLENPRHKDPRW